MESPLGKLSPERRSPFFFGYQKTFGKKSPNLGMNLEMNLDISQTFMSNFPHLALCANF